jgi:hypothetical protein
MEPVILGEIGACMHVLLLTLCVNVGSKLRKTPGTRLAGCAGLMSLGELSLGLNLACLVAVPCCLPPGSDEALALFVPLGVQGISLTS